MDDDEAPRVAGVLETCIYATNLEETARFYEEVLRLEPFSRSGTRHVFFRCGHAVFLLFHPEETAGPAGELPGHGATGPGHVAFAIAEDELPRWRARLIHAGVAIEKEMRWPRGGASLYLRDPAGNSVELATPSIWSIPESAFEEARPDR